MNRFEKAKGKATLDELLLLFGPEVRIKFKWGPLHSRVEQLTLRDLREKHKSKTRLYAFQFGRIWPLVEYVEGEAA